MKTTSILTYLFLALYIVISAACKPSVIVGNLDHFLVYDIDDITVYCEEAELKGVFDSDWTKHDVTSLSFFANPTWKRHNDRVYKIVSEDHHLTWYTLESKPEKERQIEINNQFGDQKLTLGNADFLLAPTAKVRLMEVMPMPDDLDHYKVYEVISHSGFEGVNLKVGDQFSDKMTAYVIEPKFFAVPTMKQHRSTFARILKENDYITFYSIDPGTGVEDPPDYLMTKDQFCGQLINVNKPEFLGVPTKLSTEPPSPDTGNHYLVYDVDDIDVDPDETVVLETRYHKFTCITEELNYFVNPVKKSHEGKVSEIIEKGHHATIYKLNQIERLDNISLNVENQFGNQSIKLNQPELLFVPSGKTVPTRDEVYPIPKKLNHYLLYKIEGETLPASMSLTDQFVTDMPTGLWKPAYYGIPVIKTHRDTTCEILDPHEDLLFYEIKPDFNSSGIPKTFANDQFMPPTQLDHFVPVYLAVPTSLIIE